MVIGGSGTGKSVLIKCILGLVTPDAGIIEIDGEDVLKAPRHRARQLRGQIGMLFQNGALFDSLAVWENVAFGLLAERKIRRAAARDKAVEVLAQVGLDATVGELSPAELSGGMQKRVALARAIAAEPAIMFFDEPTTGLDPIMGAVIDELIVDCVKRARQHLSRSRTTWQARSASPTARQCSMRGASPGPARPRSCSPPPTRWSTSSPMAARRGRSRWR